MAVTDKLRKLLILTKQGTPGESANAQRLLMKLMEKHGLSLDQFEETATVDCTLTFKNKHERELIKRITFFVLQVKSYVCRSPSKNKWVICSINPAQAVEIEFLYSHHRQRLAKVLEASTITYNMKNFPLDNLLNDIGDTEYNPPSEVSQMAAKLWNGIPVSSPTRQITGVS